MPNPTPTQDEHCAECPDGPVYRDGLCDVCWRERDLEESIAAAGDDDDE